MLKAFFVVTDEYENTGFAVVANDSEQAVEIVRQEEFVPADEPLETWEIGADIEGLALWIVEGIEGLRRSLYAWVDYVCPLCHKTRKLTVSEENGLEGLICCSDCEESRIDELIAKESA